MTSHDGGQRLTLPSRPGDRRRYGGSGPSDGSVSGDSRATPSRSTPRRPAAPRRRRASTPTGSANGSSTTSPVSRLPLTLRAHRRGAVQPDLPGRSTPPAAPSPCAGRRQPRPAHRPRHGPRVPGHHRPRARRRVPVPGDLGLCQDEAVNGAPSTSWSSSTATSSATPRRPSAALDLAARRRAGRVDGRHPGRAPRRRRRRRRAGRPRPTARATSTASSGAGTSSSADSPVDGVDHGRHRRARSTTAGRRHPAAAGTAIVHGDYRLDNTVLDADGAVRAVLDWEICTLGDPLADLGLLMVYWTEAGDEAALLGGAPTTVPGFPGRAEVLDALPGGVGPGPVGRLDFYVAFGYWKLACILQGVYARYVGGAPAGRPQQRRRRSPPASVRLAEMARRHVWRASMTGRRATMTALRTPHGPVLDRPVLVVALEGWVDAGLGADGAIAALLVGRPDRAGGHLRRRVLHRPAGPPSGGPHRQRRQRRAHLARRSRCAWARTWPAPTSVYLVGPEPDFRWPSFVDAVVEPVPAS